MMIKEVASLLGGRSVFPPIWASLASFLVLLMIVGLFLQKSGLETASTFFNYLGMPLGAIEWLDSFENWLQDRSGTVLWIAGGLLLVALLMTFIAADAPNGRRPTTPAAASAYIAFFILETASHTSSEFALNIGAILLFALVGLVLGVFVMWRDDRKEDIPDRFLGGLIDLGVTLVYLPATLCARLTNSYFSQP